ncbi:MAG: hypothetical protein JJ891_16830 [Rhizobiaceae bacterium]|nr:hypothetical protein [Rhizobiaceae bacterium]
MSDNDKLPAWTGTHAGEIETPADPERTAAATDRAGTAPGTEPATDPDAIEPDLFMPDPDGALPLPLEPAENKTVAKRERGRPPGSKNKKDTDLLQFLMQRGYNTPLQAGAAIYNMDTLELTRKVGAWRRQLTTEYLEREGFTIAQIKAMRKMDQKALKKHGVPKRHIDVLFEQLPDDPLEVLKLQMAVARDQLPYWHAKKSGDEAPPEQVRPVMNIGTLNVQQNNHSGSMSAGLPPDGFIEQNQDFIEGETVQQDKEPLHKTDK